MQKQGDRLMRKAFGALVLILMLATTGLAIDYSDTPQVGQAFEALLPRLKRRRIHVQKSVKVEKSSVYSSRTYKVTSTSGPNVDFESEDASLIENINIYDPKIIYRPRYSEANSHPDLHLGHQQPQIVQVHNPQPRIVQIDTVVHQQVHQVPIVHPVVVQPAIIQPEPHVVVINEQHLEPTVVQPIVHIVGAQAQPQPAITISQAPPQNPYGIPVQESELDKLLETNSQQVVSPQVSITVGSSQTGQSPLKSLAQTGLSSNSRLTSKRGQLKASANPKLINLALVASASEGLHTVTKRSRLSAKRASGSFTKLAQVKAEQRSSNGHTLSSIKGSLQSRAVAGSVNLAEASSTTIGLQMKPSLSGEVNLARSVAVSSANSNLRGHLGDHTAEQASASQKLLSQGTQTSSANGQSGNQGATASTATSQAAIQSGQASGVAAVQQQQQKASSAASGAAQVQSLVRPSPLEHAPPVDELDDLDDEPTTSRIVSLARTEKSGLAAMKTVGDLRSASYITSFASVKEAEDEGLLNSVKF